MVIYLDMADRELTAPTVSKAITGTLVPVMALMFVMEIILAGRLARLHFPTTSDYTLS